MGNCRLQNLPTNSGEEAEIKVQHYERAVEQDWPRDVGHPVNELINRLRPFYAWPDKLAERYADAYRSAFILAYSLAAAAVGLALAPLALHLQEHGAWEIVIAIGELAAIGSILALVVFGRYRNWHERWLDYRLLAEIVRHQRLVAPLGGLRAAPQVPEHWSSFGDPGVSWMAWYARAVERSLGLPTAVVDRMYLERCLADLKAQLTGENGQIGFHEKSSARSHRIEHRLHFVEILLLVFTILCCLQHILQAVFPHHWPQIDGHLLTFVCGFFPACGAALAGISNQGEFRRIAQRSRSMADQLKVKLQQVEAVERQLADSSSTATQLSPELSNAASTTSQLMVNEVLDWRVIFQDRPLRTT